ncbi:MAG TPA: hypothetical protein VGD05_06915 [Pyrinomonadaceae bacterium]|jgi:hypothetical protein
MTEIFLFCFTARLVAGSRRKIAIKAGASDFEQLPQKVRQLFYNGEYQAK